MYGSMTIANQPYVRAHPSLVQRAFAALYQRRLGKGQRWRPFVRFLRVLPANPSRTTLRGERASSLAGIVLPWSEVEQESLVLWHQPLFQFLF